MTTHPALVPILSRAQVDVFAFGVILWCMWARQAPYAGQDVSRLLLRIMQGRVVRPPLPGGLRGLSSACATALHHQHHHQQLQQPALALGPKGLWWCMSECGWAKVGPRASSGAEVLCGAL